MKRTTWAYALCFVVLFCFSASEAQAAESLTAYQIVKKSETLMDQATTVQNNLKC